MFFGLVMALTMSAAQSAPVASANEPGGWSALRWGMSVAKATAALRRFETPVIGTLKRLPKEAQRTERYTASYSDRLGAETESIELYFYEDRLCAVFIYFRPGTNDQYEQLRDGLSLKYGPLTSPQMLDGFSL
jgi:hypothetical protein